MYAGRAVLRQRQNGAGLRIAGRAAKTGLAPCAFKCGPDYIDPMFHRSVLGVESHNLDLFLCGEDAARTLYARHAAGHGAAVVEGVMGFTTAWAA